MEDPRIEKLRALVRQAIELRENTERLIIELTAQLHEAFAADDRGVPSRVERRLKPRTI